VADQDLKGIVEALLFAADAPVSVEKLREITGTEKLSDVRGAIAELVREYEEACRAFTITEIAGGWQIYCRPDYSKWIRELHRGRVPTRVSQAALETLAIVAYKQPIVRAEIEGIRGVDSSGVLSTLLRRNLIAIAGRAPGMGRPLMYRTTNEFLRYFGLAALTDLPRLEEFAEVLGLRAEELELAVEGAESVAGIGVPSANGNAGAEAPAGEDDTDVGAGADGGEATDGAPVPDEQKAHALADREILDTGGDEA